METVVTTRDCWDRKERHHWIMESDNGYYAVVCEAGVPDKILNSTCPAHTVSDAERLARVYWMDTLGWRFAETKIAGLDKQLA